MKIQKIKTIKGYKSFSDFSWAKFCKDTAGQEKVFGNFSVIFGENGSGKGYMTAEEGEKRWPALRGHESDRIVEIQETFKAAKEGRDITSKDHRVVQAIAMWGKVNNKKVNILYPNAVNKSWPQFWDFLESFNSQT